MFSWGLWLKKEQAALNGNRDKNHKENSGLLEDLKETVASQTNASVFPDSSLNTLLENRRWGFRQRGMCHLLALLKSPFSQHSYNHCGFAHRPTAGRRNSVTRLETPVRNEANPKKPFP